MAIVKEERLMTNHPCKTCEGYGVLEDITWRSFARGLEPCGEDVPCEDCDGRGYINEDDPDDT